MNTVLLELNSYTQEAKIFLNGKEPSPYSELKNYKYKQLIEKPDAVFAAIARELNDDFALSVVAPACIYERIALAAGQSEYCESYALALPTLNLTTYERIMMLGEVIPSASYTVLLTNSPVIPVFDVMLEFAEIYGEWSDYFGDYKWQNLGTCARYFDYEGTGNLHDSLEDAKVTVFCYNAMTALTMEDLRME